MLIFIPLGLDAQLDEIWRSQITELCTNVEVFLIHSPTLFPEYTIHNWEHINRVLFCIDKLIPTGFHLKSEYIGLTICATILHDLGMFLYKDNINKLFDQDKTIVDGMGDELWSVLWEKYKQELRHSGINISALPAPNEAREMDEDDILIYGEFFRRHHGRLAHEIALQGFMGQSIIPSSFSEKKRKMIGLIARSHTMTLRSQALDEYCEGNAFPTDMPIYFLMSLLRLADILDIGEERAPYPLYQMHTFLSTRSDEEWQLNQVFDFKSFGWDTAKQVIMNAEPKSTITYTRAEQRVVDAQLEFDTAWAVVDEKHNGYRFSIHRVTSNLQKSIFRSTCEKNFLTKHAQLQASSDILPLLVSPLYDNIPTYAVRELVQNAVDACREREDIEGCDNYNGEVIVDFNTQARRLTITDNGIGMTADTIRNFFLVVGESYRNSADWGHLHKEDDGQARIVRGGRFGIGALAIFLLGKKATVMTKHISEKSDYWYRFTFDNCVLPLDVNRINLCMLETKNSGYNPLPNSGTRIVVELDYVTINNLRLDGVHRMWFQWYCLSNPKVLYSSDKLLISPLQDNKLFDEIFDEKKEGCYTIESGNSINMFRCDIIFNNETDKNHNSKFEMIHNGIWVSKGVFDELSNSSYYGYRFSGRIFSFLDPNNQIELSLKRDKIISLPKSLIYELCKIEIARLLTWNQFGTLKRQKFGRYLISTYNSNYILVSYSFMKNAGIKSYYSITTLNRKQTVFDCDKPIFWDLQNDNERMSDYLCIQCHDVKNAEGYIDLEEAVYIWSFNNFLSHEIAKVEIHDRNDVRKLQRYSPNQSSPHPLPDELKVSPKNPVIIEYETEIKDFPDDRNIMLQVLHEYLVCEITYPNPGWIPIDFEDRIRKYPKAFRELRDYMKVGSKQSAIINKILGDSKSK